MSIDRAVFAFGGIMILVSVALTQLHNPLWMWFTVFIGVNMFQAAFTGFCPAAMIFKKAFGLREGCAFK